MGSENCQVDTWSTQKSFHISGQCGTLYCFVWVFHPLIYLVRSIYSSKHATTHTRSSGGNPTYSNGAWWNFVWLSSGLLVCSMCLSWCIYSSDMDTIVWALCPLRIHNSMHTFRVRVSIGCLVVVSSCSEAPDWCHKQLYAWEYWVKFWKPVLWS